MVREAAMREAGGDVWGAGIAARANRSISLRQLRAEVGRQELSLLAAFELQDTEAVGRCVARAVDQFGSLRVKRTARPGAELGDELLSDYGLDLPARV